MTITWCMVPEISSTTNKIFCHFGPFFAFYPPNNPKNQSFEKLKKTYGDIITLHQCTINDNQMMYGSWDMKHDEQKLLPFFIIFCPFTPWKPKKSKSWKNEKKKKMPGDIIILHMCTLNDSHMMYGSWDMECNGQNFL